MDSKFGVSLVAEIFPGGSEVKDLLPMWETQVRSLGREDPLTKRKATHSSILAWRTPWTEKPVLFTGSQGQTPAEKYHFLFHCGGGRCLSLLTQTPAPC